MKLTRSRKGLALIAAVITVLACLAILELGLRVIGRQPSNMTDGIFEQYKNTYRLKKDLVKISHTPSYTCKIVTNAHGFRDQETGAAPIGRKPFIVYVGESLTFGNGVDFGETFVGVSGRLLDREGMDVVNLAVGGHRFPEQEELLRDFLSSAPARPSAVLIVFSPMFIEGFEDARPGIVVKNGYIFDASNWFWPYVRVMMGNVSASYCFFRDNIRRIQVRFQGEGTAAIRAMLSSYAVSGRMNTPEVKNRLFDRIEAVDELILAAGAVPVHVYLPLSTDFGLPEVLSELGEAGAEYDLGLYLTLLKEYSAGRDVPLIDVGPVLGELHRAGGKLNFEQDAHYNAEANSVIGEFITRALMEGIARGRS